ncbi:MAG: hypothetical protein PHS48_04105 [Bacteroidales bacterium]|nr:hypothetical protein [Bacteroidales bacterium]
MSWGLKTNITPDFEREVMGELDALLLRLLKRLGEESLVRIRNRSSAESWNDQTGNLRASIGYGVVMHGALVFLGGCNGTYGTTGGAEGRKEGKAFLRRIASEHADPKGFALILVAGMEYASYVEEMENKDVLNSTGLVIYARLKEEAVRLENALVKRIEKKNGIAA